MPLTQNTVVRASAGTGKTRKLVETWVDLVAAGTDPMRIVAVTFTEKAAGEMRDRVRSAIRDRMAELQPAEHGYWLRVLGVLPAAPISTIHGFCGLLLREQGLHAGIDPSFTILDEQRSLDLARRAAVETLRNEIRSGNADAQRLFGDFGLDALVETMVNAAYWTNSLGKDPAWLRESAERQAEAGEALRPLVAEYLDKHNNDFEQIGLFADEQEAKKSRHPFRKLNDPDAVLPRIGQIAGVEVARALAKLISRSVECFRANKRAGNVMDFDDLLLHTRNLLRDSAGIRRYYQTHFQALLVDEFQDTDEVQADIIRLLARDPADETRFATAKLLIVGDPKQSIYRFRRARVTVFVHMADEILANGGVLEHLRENRRAAAPLVEFSNLLSESMMDGAGKMKLPAEVDASYRIRFSEMDVLEPRSDRRFLGITYVAAGTESRAAEGRVMEADALGRLLKAWKSSGVIQSWREVAFLMRGMTNVGIYADALESHDVPVYVVQGATFYQKTEVSDLIAALEFVCHPEDPVARAIVWSSSLAGVSFEDLLSGRTSPDLETILRPWIEQRDRATAAEILEDVIRRTSFDVVMMAQKNGDQRVANIGKLIEITRNLGRQGTTALDDVVRFLRDRAGDTTVRESEAQILGQDEEVVRILTVHQAKGLEFDVVVMPDLAARAGGSSSSRTLFSDRWGILAGAAYGSHRKALPHAQILRGKDEEEDQQFEEEKRLLYVAVTRARRMLVLGEGFSGRTGPWLQWVQALFEKFHPGVLESARGGQSARVRFRTRGQIFPVEMLSAVALTKPEQLSLNINMASVNSDALFREFQVLGEELSRPSTWKTAAVEMTPSDLTALGGCFRYFHWTRILGLSEPGRAPSGDTPQMKRGSLAHKVLETGVLPPAEVLAVQGLEDLQAVFASGEWKELSNSGVERELAFMMCLTVADKDCFVRGRMDAVVSGNPFRVIDYKFASWKEGAEAAYEIQMTAYCLALMKSIGADRVVGELWYLKSPMRILRREYTRADSEARLAGLLHRYTGALATGDWPLAARSYCDSVECGFRPECWPSPSLESAILNPKSEIPQ
jgi:ATP-dependent helicase/nuclease subunit A